MICATSFKYTATIAILATLKFDWKALLLSALIGLIAMWFWCHEKHPLTEIVKMYLMAPRTMDHGHDSGNKTVVEMRKYLGTTA